LIKKKTTATKMAAMCRNLVLGMSRLSLIQYNVGSVKSFTNAAGPLMFRATGVLGSEPMKKRKKMDINIILGREAKRRRKLEKAIKKQELKGQKLKPIEEIEGDRHVLKTLDKRKRVLPQLSFEESEYRALLHKSWSSYKAQQFAAECNTLQRLMNSQSRALLELRQESEQLYQQAIEIDEKLIPFEAKGPMETPPIKGYMAPDGDYIDTTRKYDK